MTNEEQFLAAEESENKKYKEKASTRKKDKGDESDKELAEISEDTNSASTFEDEEGIDLRACTIKFPPATEFELYDCLRQVWTDINPPKWESAIKSKLSIIIDK